MAVVALIAARGGSKGIPKKNLMDFCGRPLLAWSIDHAALARAVDDVWVTSDSEEILDCATAHGALPILRPGELATDGATSEAAWLHAVDHIERERGAIEMVVALQATSPLREPSDIDRGIDDFRRLQCDSMFSAGLIGDFYIWARRNGELESLNYDWRNRGHRLDFEEQYVENGSFYVFTPRVLRETGNRFGGKIGLTLMEFWKSFEIDSTEDIQMCEALMRYFLIHGDRVSNR